MNKWLCLVFVILLVSTGLFLFLSKDKPKTEQNTVTTADTVRYVALGDSYSIGEGVKETDRWPDQLVNMLEFDQMQLEIVANPSRTGYTTQDLLDKEIDVLKESNADFVTLQIGVNDYFQGIQTDVFEKQFVQVLDAIKQTAPEAKLLIVTIPDYGKTPSGASTGNPDTIAAGINEFNAIIKKTASNRTIPVADVFEVSQKSTAAGNIAPDGLHPSAQQYTDWLKVIEPAARELLR